MDVPFKSLAVCIRRGLGGESRAGCGLDGHGCSGSGGDYRDVTFVKL